MKSLKIVWVEKPECRKAEAEIEGLINGGWQIQSTAAYATGFVVILTKPR